MVAGREQLFRNTPASIRRWKWLVLWAAVLFVPFHIVRSAYPAWVEGCPRLAMPLDIALPSISNFLLMVVLVGLFTLIWYDRGEGFKFQRLFIPYGRMSLTNYILQSIVGVTLFYGFGLGLYRYTGATLCLLIALGIFMLQLLFSRWWLSRHRQGPLEWVWKKLTWLGAKRF